MGKKEWLEIPSLLWRRSFFLSFFYRFDQLHHGEWFFEEDHVILNSMA